MVTVDARAVEIDDVTFVVGTLQGGAVPARVRLVNRLDGPVWPPRRMGKPAAGWDEVGYEGVVPAEQSVAIGYACPAAPVDPPLEIVDSEHADERDADFETAASVLRGLGSPAPPREALALPAGGERGEDQGCRHASPASPIQTVDHDHDPAANDGRGDEESGPESTTRARVCQPSGEVELPNAVATWLDQVDDRIQQAERLAAAEDVPGATEVVREVGSLDAACDLEDRRHADARRLRELTKRANALSDRAERATVPVDTLQRLA